MDIKDKELIIQFKKRLEKEVPLVKCLLFGSRARQDHKDNSDYDFFILIERNSPEIEKNIRDIAWEVAFEYNTFINTVVFSKDDLETRLGHSMIYQNIQNEGIVV